MMPTVLDALGIESPTTIRGVTQSPIEGVSLAETFDNDAADEKHLTQYFEMFGHRSLYHDGWRAVCPWPGTSFVESGRVFGDIITYDMLNRTGRPRLRTLSRRRGCCRDAEPRRCQRRSLIAMSSACGTTKRASITCCPSTAGGRQHCRGAATNRSGTQQLRTLSPHAGHPCRCGAQDPQSTLFD